jgi:hypothetical protein
MIWLHVGFVGSISAASKHETLMSSKVIKGPCEEWMIDSVSEGDVYRVQSIQAQAEEWLIELRRSQDVTESLADKVQFLERVVLHVREDLDPNFVWEMDRRR